jgi:hypothetical protein
MTPRALLVLVVIDLGLVLGVAAASPCPRSRPEIARDPGAATVRLKLRYDGDPRPVIAAWALALAQRRGWKVESTERTITAANGHDRVSIEAATVAMWCAKPTTIVTVVFAPG